MSEPFPSDNLEVLEAVLAAEGVRNVQDQSGRWAKVILIVHTLLAGWAARMEARDTHSPLYKWPDL